MVTEAEKANAKLGGYEVLLTNFGREDSFVVYLNGQAFPEKYGSESDAWSNAVGRRWKDQNDRG